MEIDKEELEKRLERLVNLKETMNVVISSIPIDISDDIKKMIIDKVLGDPELDNLINAIKNRRSPRFLLMGRTGVGKSSLINALFKDYLAEVSDVEVGTSKSKKYSLESSSGEIVAEIIDTRGIGESENDGKSAEEVLKEDVRDFRPDAVLFLVRSKERSHIDKDMKSLKEVYEFYNGIVPIIALSTQVDELEPSRYKNPNNYPNKKISNIEEAKIQLERILINNNVNVLEVLPVSSYLEWAISGTDEIINPKEINTKENDLDIIFNGLYNIDALEDLLINNMDLKASIQFSLNTNIDKTIINIANILVKRFSVVAGIIGTNPIPVSDILILTPLQISLIMIIAYLSGKDLDYKHAKDAFITLGGASVAGKLLQQGAKFLNIVFPGGGSATSGAIAASGTYGIGKAAIAYFMQGASEQELKRMAREEKEHYESHTA